MVLFTLISKKQVSRSSGRKIIPAKEFSSLKEADEILQEVKEESEQFKGQTLEECEVLKESASRDGYQTGLEKFNAVLLRLSEEMGKIQEECAQQILPIALKAAKKIVGEELQILPERITDIVMQALKPVTQHHRIKIYVNKVDLDILEKNKSKIKKILEQAENFSIQERMDVEPGGCIIETEAGIINAQLDNQWRALEAAFKQFMKKA